MKIAFINQPLDDVLPPNQNSIAIWTSHVAHHLARTNEVTIYARLMRSPTEASLDETVRYRFVRSAPLRVWNKVNKVLRQFFPTRRPFFASGFYYLDYILQIALDLRKQQYDVIHLFNFSQFVPIIRAIKPEAKIVLRMSCEWLTQLDPLLVDRRLKDVDLIIGCSDYITEKIRRAFPQHAHRCRTVYNGRDVNHFFPENNGHAAGRPDPKRLLFIGRISPEKGVHVLVDALSRVVERYPETTLEIVGPTQQLAYDFLIGLSDDDKISDLASFYDGVSLHSYFSYLKERLRALNIDRHVKFVGSVPHLQLLDYYRTADIFIFPSVWNEPSGNPPIEAMATGVPVISTRTGGTAEYVADGQTGLLVEPDDPAALAQAILQLLENNDLRKTMGRAGRKRAVELYSYEQLAQNLRQHYQDICEKSWPRHRK